jgi:hypothetical protein
MRLRQSIWEMLEFEEMLEMDIFDSSDTNLIDSRRRGFD